MFLCQNVKKTKKNKKQWYKSIAFHSEDYRVARDLLMPEVFFYTGGVLTTTAPEKKMFLEATADGEKKSVCAF